MPSLSAIASGVLSISTLGVFVVSVADVISAMFVYDVLVPAFANTFNLINKINGFEFIRNRIIIAKSPDTLFCKQRDQLINMDWPLFNGFKDNAKNSFLSKMNEFIGAKIVPAYTGICFLFGVNKALIVI